MTKPNHTIALMSAVRIPEGEAGAAPEWIHLLPAGVNGMIQTDDKRGPYRAGNADEIIAASFAVHDRLPIDENHATDIAAPQGNPAPARGWITAMQAREDGIWGQVEWTPEGENLVVTRAYRDISPAIYHDKAKQVRIIPRASLVNQPNLRGMASLHQKETEMGLRDLLIKALNLSEDATDDDIVKAVNAQPGDDKEPALQSAMGEIGVMLGLAENAGPDAIKVALQSVQTAAQSDDTKDGLIKELQSSVTKLSTSLTALQSGLSAGASEAFYTKALQEKRAGVGPASKDHLISLHQSDPAQAEAFVAAMPMLDQAGLSILPPAAKDGTIALNSSQRTIAGQLGMSEEDYVAHLKEMGA